MDKPRFAAGALAAALLGAALVFGGGGNPAPQLELGLELAACVIAAGWLLTGPRSQSVPRDAWLIVLAFAGLPLLQLVPLPPALWHALPGREGERAALNLIGAADSWRPLALSPARTLASLLSLGPPLLLLVMTTTLQRRERSWLVAVAAMGGLATLLVGAAQISGGTGNPFRFFDPNQIFLTGFQANHNSTADLLLAAMIALCAVLWNGSERGFLGLDARRMLWAVAGIDLVFGLGLFLAGSRTALALVPLVFMIQWLILGQGRQRRLRGLSLWLLSLGAIALLGALLLRNNREIAAITARFAFAGEFRPELWRDSWFALRQVWPAGAGMGGFLPVMIAGERLEVVAPALPNRAHNDFLEFAIEGGLPGILLFLAVGLRLALVWRKALTAPPAGARSQILFGSGVLTLFGLHSLVDYPLRSMALASLAAVAVGLLIPPKPDTDPKIRDPKIRELETS